MILLTAKQNKFEKLHINRVLCTSKYFSSKIYY